MSTDYRKGHQNGNTAKVTAVRLLSQTKLGSQKELVRPVDTAPNAKALTQDPEGGNIGAGLTQYVYDSISLTAKEKKGSVNKTRRKTHFQRVKRGRGDSQKSLSPDRKNRTGREKETSSPAKKTRRGKQKGSKKKGQLRQR